MARGEHQKIATIIEDTGSKAVKFIEKRVKQICTT